MQLMLASSNQLASPCIYVIVNKFLHKVRDVMKLMGCDGFILVPYLEGCVSTPL